MVSVETEIRVRYADTDQMKMVYYGRFFEYFEQGRSDLLRGIGLPYPDIERMGYFLPVIEAQARYHRSARYDDLLRVRTMVREMPGARVRIEYEIFADGTKDPLVSGFTVHTFVNASTGKPARAPARFTEAIASALGPDAKSGTP
jgi:acyl-CoA thioester hydrolase